MVGGVFPLCLILGRLYRCGGDARGKGRGDRSMFRAGRYVGGSRRLKGWGLGLRGGWGVRGRGFEVLGRLSRGHERYCGCGGLSRCDRFPEGRRRHFRAWRGHGRGVRLWLSVAFLACIARFLCPGAR